MFSTYFYANESSELNVSDPVS